MAIGRIINSKITKDKDVAEFSDDTSRLAFTWLITFADKEGRTYGDPAIVKAMLFPRRDNMTTEQMAAYIHEWQKSGSITWYEVDDEQFIYFINFDKNQPGLRKDREGLSVIPEPEKGIPVVYIEPKIDSGETPAQVPVKLKDIKLNQVIRKEVPAKKTAGNLYPIAVALSEVSGWDFEKNRGRLFKVAGKFKQGDEEQILRDFSIGGAWYLYDWRGLRNQKPTPEQVIEKWNNLNPIPANNSGVFADLERLQAEEVNGF